MLARQVFLPLDPLQQSTNISIKQILLHTCSVGKNLFPSGKGTWASGMSYLRNEEECSDLEQVLNVSKSHFPHS
jgi:hypothetical protein